MKNMSRRVRISGFLANAIKGIEQKIDDKELKPTIGDYMKLLQLERELDEDSPKEIKVTWIEPGPESSEK